jgi:hypothetical protein
MDSHDFPWLLKILKIIKGPFPALERYLKNQP